MIGEILPESVRELVGRCLEMLGVDFARVEIVWWVGLKDGRAGMGAEQVMWT